MERYKLIKQKLLNVLYMSTLMTSRIFCQLDIYIMI